MSSLVHSQGHGVSASRITIAVLAAAMLCLLLVPVRAGAASGEVLCCSTDSNGVPGNSAMVTSCKPSTSVQTRFPVRMI